MYTLRYCLIAVLIAFVAVAFSPAQVKPPAGKENPLKPDKDKDKDKDGDKPTISEIGGKTLSQWIKESYSSDPGTRENAVRTIMLFGPSGAPAGPAMVDRLKDTDVSLRVNACLALAAIDVGSADIPKAVDTLSSLVTNDRESIVRFHAGVALGTFGKDAKSAIPNLVRASTDPYSWEIRKVVCFALGKAGEAAKTDPLDMRAANALIHVLNKDLSAHVRLEAAIALGGMGKPALPADRKMMEDALKHAANTDRDETVRIWCVVGVMAINDGEAPEKFVGAIADFLKRPQLPLRVHAARALGTIGSKAVSRVPDLVAMLSDKVPEGRLAAVWALAHIGPEAHTAIPNLKKIADDKDADPALKQAAKDAIDAINGKKKP